MSIPPPDGDSAVAIMKWFVALLVAAVTALSGFVLWIISQFSEREKTVLNANAESVDSLADVVESQNSAIEAVGQHLEKANQLEHDRQLLEADRQRRGQ